MTGQTWLVFGVLLTTVALFASDRLRLDLVALMSLLALLVSKVLTTKEALAGFSEPLVLIIAGLFVVGGALLRSGVAERIGQLLGRIAGKRPSRLIATVMIFVAVLSAFVSSTGTVAILLPVVVRLAEDAQLSPSKLLMPLSLASLLGGLLTLIGTPPNLVVSQHLAEHGQRAFGFFEFAPVGGALVVLGVAFVATVGWRLLPDRRTRSEGTAETGPQLAELERAYNLRGNLWWLEVGPTSSLLDKTVAEADLGGTHRVTILGVRKQEGDSVEALEPEHRFAAGEALVVHGRERRVRALGESLGLASQRVAETAALVSDEAALAEVVLTPRSQLVGRNLRDARFRDVYELSVVAILRRGRAVTAPLGRTRLRFGDALLVQGLPERVKALDRSRSDLVVVGVPAPTTPQLGLRGFTTLALMLAMLALMTLKILPMVTAVLLAATAMVLLRCLDMEQAYRAINWQSLVLIAAMLPMATALKKTGGIDVIVNALMSLVGESGPRWVMSALFLLTALFSQFVSNTATSVLIAPVAVKAAMRLSVSPRPLLMTVAIAASSSFATPVASPVNTLVMAPGGYRFGDYAKLGVLLQLLALAVTLLLVPALFPLR